MSRPAGPPAPPDAPPAARTDTPAGTPSGDPVRALMAEHRRLCEEAVHPLEIAAGLEDAGLTDRAAARFRHADLFALAEELYARVERRPAAPAPPPPAAPWPGQAARALGTALLHLPAAGLLATVPWLLRVLGPGAAVAAALVAIGWLALAAPAPRPAARIGYALGAALLLVPGAAAGGPASAAVLALGAGTADFAARRLRAAGRSHLAAAKTADEFRARMRPLLPLAAAVQFAAAGLAGALLPLGAEGLPGPAGWAGQGVLAVLLLLAVVLLRCGRAAVAAGATALTGAALALLPQAGAGLRLGVASAVVAVLLPAVRSLLGRPWTHHPAPAAGGPAG
ncbi:hypothetical protein [Kitasatospora sp. NBC_01539]|uniref:hypothetical protein n=1 Tax=Kitasatospora sp. NBC_01539 TaxID=2903577 RepID=UPI0038602123